MVKKIIKIITVLIVITLMTLLLATNVFASGVVNPAISNDGGGDLASSPLATGGLKLLKDATSILLVVILLVGGTLWIAFHIRKGAAIPQEQNEWQKRINTVIVCTVLGSLGSSILNLILGYFQ